MSKDETGKDIFVFHPKKIEVIQVRVIISFAPHFVCPSYLMSSFDRICLRLNMYFSVDYWLLWKAQKCTHAIVYLRVLRTQLTTNSNNPARVLERGLLIIYEVQQKYFPQICAKVSVLCLSIWSLIGKGSISKSNVFPSRINSKFS